VRVERSSGLFGRKGGVKRLTVTLGDEHLSLARAGGGIAGERRHVVRGIVLRRDEVPLAEWVDDLARALTAHAESVAADRAALERLLH
jgi:hypothetical protein